MNKLKNALKTFVQWAFSNWAYGIYSAVISALAQPARSFIMQSLNANLIVAFLIVGWIIFTLLWFLSRFVKRVLRKFESTRTETQSNLELKFDPNLDSSVKTGQQENGFTSLFRLSLINKSVTESIEKIQVSIEEIIPNQSLGILPARLGFMHDLESRLDHETSLAVDFIEVRHFKNIDGETKDQLILSYIVDNTKERQRVTIDKWNALKFVIRVRK